MLFVRRLESGVPRVRLDMHADDLGAEVARLERLGAERGQKAHAWWVLRDPAGLLFCVLPISPGSLNEENARCLRCKQRGSWASARTRYLEHCPRRELVRNPLSLPLLELWGHLGTLRADM